MITWKEKQISTMSDLQAAVLACDSKAEAKQFLDLYTADVGIAEDFAKDNIGYMAGYCSREDAIQIFDMFDCEHPIFGRHKPSMEQALKAGMRTAELSKQFETRDAIKMVRKEFETEKTFENIVSQITDNTKSQLQ